MSVYVWISLFNYFRWIHTNRILSASYSYQTPAPSFWMISQQISMRYNSFQPETLEANLLVEVNLVVQQSVT